MLSSLDYEGQPKEFAIAATTMAQEVIEAFVDKTRGPGELQMVLIWALCILSDPKLNTTKKGITKEELVQMVETAYDITFRKEQTDAS